MPIVLCSCSWLLSCLSTHCNIENITEHITKTVDFAYWQNGCRRMSNQSKKPGKQAALYFPFIWSQLRTFYQLIVCNLDKILLIPTLPCALKDPVVYDQTLFSTCLFRWPLSRLSLKLTVKSGNFLTANDWVPSLHKYYVSYNTAQGIYPVHPCTVSLDEITLLRVSNENSHFAKFCRTLTTTNEALFSITMH